METLHMEKVHKAVKDFVYHTGYVVVGNHGTVAGIGPQAIDNADFTKSQVAIFFSTGI